MAILLQVIIGVAKPFFEVLIDTFLREFFKPVKVEPEVRPVLETLNVQSNESINRDLVSRFSIL